MAPEDDTDLDFTLPKRVAAEIRSDATFVDQSKRMLGVLSPAEAGDNLASSQTDRQSDPNAFLGEDNRPSSNGIDNCATEEIQTNTRETPVKSSSVGVPESATRQNPSAFQAWRLPAEAEPTDNYRGTDDDNREQSELTARYYRHHPLADCRNKQPYQERVQPPRDTMHELAQVIANAIHRGNNHPEDQQRAPKGFRRPERFNGKQPWNEYKTHFEMCAGVNRWNMQEKAMHLAASLDGPALQLLSNLSNEDRQNYYKLTLALKNRFENPYLQSLYRAQLANRKKQSGESVLQMGEDMKRLSRLAYPGLPEYARDEITKEYFISAIGDADAMWKIRQCRPKTIEEAICYAAELSAFRDVDRHIQRKHPNVLRTMQYQETGPVPEEHKGIDYAHLDDDTDEATEEAIEEVVRELKRNFNFKKSNRNSQNGGKKPCFGCGDHGHWIRDCPQIKDGKDQSNSSDLSRSRSESNGNRSGGSGKKISNTTNKMESSSQTDQGN